MFYVFVNSGEQESWEQLSVGFVTLKEAKDFELEERQWDEYKPYELCVMEKL